MHALSRVALGALALTVFASGAATQGAATAPPSGPQRIAYINSQKILAQAPGRAEAEAQFQKEMEGYRSQVQRIQDSLGTLMADYNKVEPTLSPTAKAARQKDIMTKQQAYQQRVNDLEGKAQQREAELIRPIMEQINKVIEQVRAEEGYAFVLDAGNQAGVVVAADPALDITDKVIAKLQQAGPVATTPNTAPAKPPEKPQGATTTKPTGVTRPKPPADR